MKLNVVSKKVNMDTELYCSVGDTVEIITTIETNPWLDEGEPEKIKKGSKYQVADLIGSGWDLKLIEGNGPKLIRILNSEMPGLVKIIKTKT